MLSGLQWLLLCSGMSTPTSNRSSRKLRFAPAPLDLQESFDSTRGYHDGGFGASTTSSWRSSPGKHSSISSKSPDEIAATFGIQRPKSPNSPGRGSASVFALKPWEKAHAKAKHDKEARRRARHLARQAEADRARRKLSAKRLSASVVSRVADLARQEDVAQGGSGGSRGSGVDERSIRAKRRWGQVGQHGSSRLRESMAAAAAAFVNREKGHVVHGIGDPLAGVELVERAQSMKHSYDVSLKPSFNRRSGMWQQVRQSERVLQRVRWGQELSGVVEEAAQGTPHDFDFAASVGESLEKIQQDERDLEFDEAERAAKQADAKWEAPESDSEEDEAAAMARMSADSAANPLTVNRVAMCIDCAGCVLCRGPAIVPQHERRADDTGDEAVEVDMPSFGGGSKYMTVSQQPSASLFQQYKRRLASGGAISDAARHLEERDARNGELAARRKYNIQHGLVGSPTVAHDARGPTSPGFDGSPESPSSRRGDGDRRHRRGGHPQSPSGRYSASSRRSSASFPRSSSPMTSRSRPKTAQSTPGSRKGPHSGRRPRSSAGSRPSTAAARSRQGGAAAGQEGDSGVAGRNDHEDDDFYDESIAGKRSSVPVSAHHSAGTRISYGQLVALQSSDGGYLTLRRGSSRTTQGAGSVYYSYEPGKRKGYDPYDGVPTWCTTASPWPAHFENDQCTVFRICNADDPQSTATVKAGDRIQLLASDHAVWMLGAHLALPRAASESAMGAKLAKAAAGGDDPGADGGAAEAAEIGDGAAAPDSPSRAARSMRAELADTMWRPAAIPLLTSKTVLDASDMLRREWRLEMMTEEADAFQRSLAEHGHGDHGGGVGVSSRKELLDKLMDKTDVCHHSLIALHQDWGHLVNAGASAAKFGEGVTDTDLRPEDNATLGTVVVSTEPFWGTSKTTAAVDGDDTQSAIDSAKAVAATARGEVRTTLGEGVRRATATLRSRTAVGQSLLFSSTSVADVAQGLASDNTKHHDRTKKAAKLNKVDVAQMVEDQFGTTLQTGRRRGDDSAPLAMTEETIHQVKERQAKERAAAEAEALAEREKNATKLRMLEGTGRRSLAEAPRVTPKGMWRICLCTRRAANFGSTGGAGKFARSMNMATRQLEETDKANAEFVMQRRRIMGATKAAKVKQHRPPDWGSRMNVAKRSVAMNEHSRRRHRARRDTEDTWSYSDSDSEDDYTGGPKQMSSFYKRHGYSAKDVFASTTIDESAANRGTLTLMKQGKQSTRDIHGVGPLRRGASTRSGKRRDGESRRNLDEEDSTEDPEADFPYLLQNPDSLPRHRLRLIAAEAKATAMAATMSVPSAVWDQMNRKTLILEMLAKNTRVLNAVKLVQRGWRRYSKKKWHRKIMRADAVVVHDLQEAAEEEERRKRLMVVDKPTDWKPLFKRPLSEQAEILDKDGWASDSQASSDYYVSPRRDEDEASGAKDGEPWPVLQSPKRSAMAGDPQMSTDAAILMAGRLVDVAAAVEREQKHPTDEATRGAMPTVADVEREVAEFRDAAEKGDAAADGADDASTKSNDDADGGSVDGSGGAQTAEARSEGMRALQRGDVRRTPVREVAEEPEESEETRVRQSLTVLTLHNPGVFGDMGEEGTRLRDILTGRQSIATSGASTAVDEDEDDREFFDELPRTATERQAHPGREWVARPRTAKSVGGRRAQLEQQPIPPALRLPPSGDSHTLARPGSAPALKASGLRRTPTSSMHRGFSFHERASKSVRAQSAGPTRRRRPGISPSKRPVSGGGAALSASRSSASMSHRSSARTRPRPRSGNPTLRARPSDWHYHSRRRDSANASPHPSRRRPRSSPPGRVGRPAQRPPTGSVPRGRILRRSQSSDVRLAGRQFSAARGPGSPVRSVGSSSAAADAASDSAEPDLPAPLVPVGDRTAAQKVAKGPAPGKQAAADAGSVSSGVPETPTATRKSARTTASSMRGPVAHGDDSFGSAGSMEDGPQVIVIDRVAVDARTREVLQHAENEAAAKRALSASLRHNQ